jgi:uncharacterized delta-60 repeat protein
MLAGDLDPSFDMDGRVITDIGTGASDTAFAVTAYETEGKVIAVGRSSADPSEGFAVVRYNADGSLDLTFGVGGKQIIDLSGTSDTARAVAVDAQGRVVVAGYTGPGLEPNDMAAVRLTSNGMLDLDFGVGGKQTVDFGGRDDRALGVAVDSQGRIVLGGTSQAPFSQDDFAVARLTEDGELDGSFASGGTLLIDFGSDEDVASGLAVDSSDRVLIAGYTSTSESGLDFAIARLSEGGALDSNFGTGGKQTFDFAGQNDVGLGVTIDSQGRVVMAGHSQQVGTGRDFAAARLSDVGELDETFGIGGKQTIDLGSTTDIGWDVSIDSQGRVVIGGHSVQAETGFDFAAARLTSDGSPDPSFGIDGKTTVDLGSTSDIGLGSTVDAQDRVILVGSSSQPATLPDFGLARLLGADPGIPVSIDIKPGNSSNKINPRSNGFIEVAILSTSSFDAVASVDAASLTFGRTGDEASLATKKGAPRIQVADVNGDGLLDLVVFFETEKTGFQSTDEEGVLRGQTIDGHSFEARDSVSIVGQK